MDTEGTPQFEDVVTKIMKLMRTTFGDVFKAFYEGDPLIIPKSNLPCVIIEVLEGLAELDATSTDKFQTRINIRLVYDKASDLNASDTDDLTERKLRRLVEGRNITTGEYLPDSVLGALRKNFTLQSRLIKNDIDWNYQLQPRAEGVVTSEALVQVVATERIIVTGRS